MVRQWESLAALVRDISSLQDQNHHLKEKLYRSGQTVQQLTVQVNQAKANLAQHLQHEQREHNNTKKSLEHEICLHAQTERCLASEREINIQLINLYSQFDLTNTNTVAVPDELKLGSLLEENRELKKATAEYKVRIEKDRYTIDSSEASIAMLKWEKEDTLYALDEKEIELAKANDQLSELCRECSDDSENEEGVQIETATLGKRKRLG